MRKSEIVLFISGSGAGKSSMFREIMLHVLETTDEKIGVISLEESPQETARKLSAMPLHKNPAEEEIPLEELKVGFDKVFGSDRVILLDHNGETEDTSIMEYIEFMALSGATYIFLDHITLATAEDGDNDNANSATDKLMSNCLKIVKKYPVFLGLISHLRKSPNGKKSYEEGLMPNVDAIKGSGSIKQISFDIVAFARNLTAQDENIRNTIAMCVLKSRYSGLTGPVQGAFYNRKTGRLSLAPKEKEFEPIITTTVNSNDTENTSY
jgi:replicative DNA helicase